MPDITEVLSDGLLIANTLAEKYKSVEHFNKKPFFPQVVQFLKKIETNLNSINDETEINRFYILYGRLNDLIQKTRGENVFFYRLQLKCLQLIFVSFEEQINQWILTNSLSGKEEENDNNIKKILTHEETHLSFRLIALRYYQEIKKRKNDNLLQLEEQIIDYESMLTLLIKAKEFFKKETKTEHMIVNFLNLAVKNDGVSAIATTNRQAYTKVCKALIKRFQDFLNTYPTSIHIAKAIENSLLFKEVLLRTWAVILPFKNFDLTQELIFKTRIEILLEDLSPSKEFSDNDKIFRALIWSRANKLLSPEQFMKYCRFYKQNAPVNTIYKSAVDFITNPMSTNSNNHFSKLFTHRIGAGWIALLLLCAVLGLIFFPMAALAFPDSSPNSESSNSYWLIQILLYVIGGVASLVGLSIASFCVIKLFRAQTLLAEIKNNLPNELHDMFLDAIKSATDEPTLAENLRSLLHNYDVIIALVEFEHDRLLNPPEVIRNRPEFSYLPLPPVVRNAFNF